MKNDDDLYDYHLMLELMNEDADFHMAQYRGDAPVVYHVHYPRREVVCPKDFPNTYDLWHYDQLIRPGAGKEDAMLFLRHGPSAEA